MARQHQLKGLMKWAERDGWAEIFDEVFDAHFGDVLDEWDLDFDDLDEIVGPEHASNLWGCAFEDFLTRPREDDALTVVDDYLKRRGWKESPSDRRYTEALRDATMSLYEVSGVVPGQSMLLTDLVFGGEARQVVEHAATRQLRDGERIAARVVDVGTSLRISGGLLRFRDELATQALEQIGAAMVEHRNLMRGTLVDMDDAPELDDEMLDAIFMVGSAADFSALWLADMLEQLLPRDEPSGIVNTDGDAVLFHRLRFPLVQRAAKLRLKARLDEASDLRRASDEIWHWVEAPAESAVAAHEDSEGGQPAVHRTSHADGSNILGVVELKPAMLVLTVNSLQRAERGHALLAELASGILGEPETDILSVADFLEAHPEMEAQLLETLPG